MSTTPSQPTLIVREIQFIPGFSAPARERAQDGVLQEARPIIFAKEPKLLILRASSCEVDPAECESRTRKERCHRALLKLAAIDEIDDLVTVIKHAPKFPEGYAAKKGFIDHRETAIGNLLRILEAL